MGFREIEVPPSEPPGLILTKAGTQEKFRQVRRIFPVIRELLRADLGNDLFGLFCYGFCYAD